MKRNIEREHSVSTMKKKNNNNNNKKRKRKKVITIRITQPGRRVVLIHRTTIITFIIFKQNK